MKKYEDIIKVNRFRYYERIILSAKKMYELTIIRGFDGKFYMKYINYIRGFCKDMYLFDEITFEQVDDETLEVKTKHNSLPSIWIILSDISEFLVQALLGKVIVNGILL